MNPKRIVCSNPWTARFASVVTIVGPKADRFRSYVFVHDGEHTAKPRPSLHRLFG